MGARFLAVLLAMIATVAVAREHRERHEESGGRFDYYLMSLSWSPSYCEAHPQDADQCAHKGFGFVLHGLWPQNRDGSWPQHCVNDVEPDAATVEHTLAFMPRLRITARNFGQCSRTVRIQSGLRTLGASPAGIILSPGHAMPAGSSRAPVLPAKDHPRCI